MKMPKIGFIGCGNMGGALVKAAAKAGFSKDIYICDNFAEKTEALSKELGVNVSDSKSIAAECDFIFMGVKPQVIDKAFAEIADILAERTDCVLVSMAAGVAIEKIKAISKAEKIIRIMPNMPVSVGEGVVLASEENVSEKNIEDFNAIMKCAGIVDWIDEKLIDAGCAVSGCGPAFVYMFIEALADGAVSCGLPRDKAMLYAAETVLGSAKAVLESGKHPGKLKDEVCSPGGTTIAGVKALEDGAFRSSAMNAVIAAYEKTKKM